MDTFALERAVQTLDNSTNLKRQQEEYSFLGQIRLKLGGKEVESTTSGEEV